MSSLAAAGAAAGSLLASAAETGVSMPDSAASFLPLLVARKARDIGEGMTLAVTASFGVVSFTPGTSRDTLELVGRADEALYRSKNEGRDRISYAD